MDSEALRNLRTMRQIKVGLDLIRKQKIRTTNSLSKTCIEVQHLQSLTDPKTERVLEREKRRFFAQQLSIDKSRQRVLRARDKLAATINRNRALIELRHDLQRGRWERRDHAVPKTEPVTAEHKLHRVELKY
jgi:hypothetical protein